MSNARLTGDALKAETLLAWVAQRADTARRRMPGEDQEAWVKRLASNTEVIEILAATRDAVVTVRESVEGVYTPSLVERAETAEAENADLREALEAMTEARYDLRVAQGAKAEADDLRVRLAESQAEVNRLRGEARRARRITGSPRLQSVPVLPRAAVA